METIRVKELIEWLSQFPKDKEVFKAIRSPSSEQGHPEGFYLDQDITSHPDDYIMIW